MSPFFSVAHGKFVFMYVFSFFVLFYVMNNFSSRRCSIVVIVDVVVTMYKFLVIVHPKRKNFYHLHTFILF